MSIRKFASTNQKHYLDLSSESHKEFLQSLLRRHFAGKPVVTTRKFLRLPVFELLSYIDLAGAKSEALDNICILLKQNIKSCNAKRRRQRER